MATGPVMDGLFFPLSKLFWMAARPESWLLGLMLLALAGLLLHRRPLAVTALSLAIAAFLVIALLRPAYTLLGPLERAYPANPDLAAPAAIVVLGGGEEAVRTDTYGQPHISDKGDRFLTAIALARQYPEARVVFTGGTGWFRTGFLPGSEVARQIFTGAGIAQDRLILEGRSLNTWQNAVNTLPLMDGLPEGGIVLVTSAFHMRRSVEVFCAAGWRNLVPYPTDFRILPQGHRLGWRFAENLAELNLAAKEWIGLLAYRHTGRGVTPQDRPGCLLP
ncbi:YdcF family protein [Meridianimarinicoccus sp. MJW13]|uniref:YdcF family protein n=1 Tax=Meridianimarinicoccus sp. MJW13 TaxID=2720031 RepID=UPI0018672FF4|nr:YdcF family protein [Fluviibacterium sp. MJW13]